MAPMEKSPFMVMWDPATYPQFNTIADIGKTDTKVLYFEGDTYMAFLTGTNVLKKSQVDGSYDGKPANFVAADGKVAQAGFATSEPYIYEHEVRQWGKPVKYALVLNLVKRYNDGWVYTSGLADYAISKMRSDFVKNGSDKTLGNFDTARVQRMIDIVTPIFTAQNQPPKAGLKPDDIATNEFIDTSIGIAG